MSINHNYAPWRLRALAYFIDNFVLIPWVFSLFVPHRYKMWAIGLGTLFFIWSTVLHQGSTGQSMGRKITRTRLVDQYTGKPIGRLRNFVRGFVHVIDCLPLFAGFFRPLWNDKSQCWTDEVMCTVVVHEPKESLEEPPRPAGWTVITDPTELEEPDRKAA